MISIGIEMFFKRLPETAGNPPKLAIIGSSGSLKHGGPSTISCNRARDFLQLCTNDNPEQPPQQFPLVWSQKQFLAKFPPKTIGSGKHHTTIFHQTMR